MALADSSSATGDLPEDLREVKLVHDSSDPRIGDYIRLTDVALRRRQEPERGLFMAESLKVIARAMAAGCEVRSVLCQPKWLPEVTRLALPSEVPVYTAEPAVLEQITGYRVHRGLLAAMQRPQEAQPADVLAPARRVVVLDGLVDHTNVGAAFRSAAALGMDAVLLTDNCADPLYRRAVRVSMGTVFQVPWARVPDHEYPRLFSGWRLLALTPDPAAAALDGVHVLGDERVAVIVGSEGPGLSSAVRSQATGVRIPMGGGVDSLNVAAAVAVAAYALRPGQPV
ncbi:MAG: RNA methyltransferase [Actinobacteria bacterium]|nr:RNA methyltransferase [Actinomycetota bacterium]